MVKQRDTAEEIAAKAKERATTKSSKRKPFSIPPVVGGKKLKKSDGPSPSTCPDVPEEENVEEERDEEESGGDGEDDGGEGQSGDGIGALSSGKAGEIQEWTDDAFRQAFEGLEERSALVEKPRKTDKAGTGASPSSESISARATPAVQGEFLTPLLTSHVSWIIVSCMLVTLGFYSRNG